MKKNGNIILVVTSLAVVGVLGYLLMRQLKATQKARNSSKLTPKFEQEAEPKKNLFQALLDWSQTDEYKKSQNKVIS